jgi:hypothetical protein
MITTLVKTRIRKEPGLKIQMITSLTSVGMITTLVRVQPLKRQNSKHHRGSKLRLRNMIDA